jgi:hypothetical protein
MKLSEQLKTKTNSRMGRDHHYGEFSGPALQLMPQAEGIKPF